MFGTIKIDVILCNSNISEHWFLSFPNRMKILLP